jgi:hypothetical protein
MSEMNNEDSAARWEFRYDFIETLLAVSMSQRDFISLDEARRKIRKLCESAMIQHGFTYPVDQDWS